MNVTELSGTALGGLVFLPACVEADTPLLVYLHGAGERGTRTDHMCRHGIPRLIVREGWEIPAIVLCPQCPAEFVWDNVVREVKSVIDDTVSRFAVRTDRISLTGCSIAGGGRSFRASNLRTTPVRAYHGAEDELVPAVYSSLMTDAVRACGGDAELTLLPGMGHNEGIEYAYEHTDVTEWLISMRRTDHTPVPEFLSEYF